MTSTEVKIINSHSCMLGWTPPSKRSEAIKGYYIEQTRLGASFGWVRVNKIVTESSFYLVPNLIPGRQYRFRVLTEDIKGRVSEGRETDIIQPFGRI